MYKCPKCGNTSNEPKQCCGVDMQEIQDEKDSHDSKKSTYDCGSC